MNTSSGASILHARYSAYAKKLNSAISLRRMRLSSLIKASAQHTLTSEKVVLVSPICFAFIEFSAPQHLFLLHCTRSATTYFTSCFSLNCRLSIRQQSPIKYSFYNSVVSSRVGTPTGGR
ncbi:hypothetical protein NPIL_567251 [Nephila pilipes]|uniref:Uncharacterized protein n=1 Tax=Nephila pilipes TaxID=299642 RepID=A0A8X6TTT2_NEPPI|nr:hypothetical protein NPIL_567251 [Nephila pilipes]